MNRSVATSGGTSGTILYPLYILISPQWPKLCLDLLDYWSAHWSFFSFPLFLIAYLLPGTTFVRCASSVFLKLASQLLLVYWQRRSRPHNVWPISIFLPCTLALNVLLFWFVLSIRDECVVYILYTVLLSVRFSNLSFSTLTSVFTISTTPFNLRCKLAMHSDTKFDSYICFYVLYLSCFLVFMVIRLWLKYLFGDHERRQVTTVTPIT